MNPWLTVLAIAMATGGCDLVKETGKGIDRVCVKGKLTAAEAASLGRLGAVEDDRIVNHDCSEALRGLTGRDAP